MKEQNKSIANTKEARTNEALQTNTGSLRFKKKKLSTQEKYSRWSYSTFFPSKNAQIERGVLGLVVDQKSFNKTLRRLRFSIPNRKGILDRLCNEAIFSNFYMKLEYWQILNCSKDTYKTASNIPIRIMNGLFMAFGLKLPLEF